MQAHVLAVAVSLLLLGCAGTDGQSTAEQTTEGPATGGQASGGGTFLSVIGTPFLIAFKIPLCAASVAIAAPLAGLSALSSDPGGRETRQWLGAGLAQNCGPPYGLTP